MNKPDLSIATVFGEEIEKQWRGHVPRECVFQLRLMAEQLMDMDNIIKNQQAIIEKLMQITVLEGNVLREVKALNKKINRHRESIETTAAEGYDTDD